MRTFWSTRCIGAVLAVGVLAVAALAEVTPEHRKELSQVVKDVAKVSGMVKKKEFSDAEKALTAAEEKIMAIATSAAVKEDDKAFNSARTAIAKARKTLDVAKAKADGRKPDSKKAISFVKDVAPIISDNCLGCHGENNPRANLRLDTFAYMAQGGRNGPIAVAGAAANSLIMGRLMTMEAEARMPKGKDPLDENEIETIAVWINQGARFDGDNETTALPDLTAAAALKSFTYPKPKGTETVSFTRDIAPFMANLCGNCHSAQRKSGGLSLVSYFDLMQGGESGEVIIPGDKENSRLYRLVGGLENPRMPQGQGRITRKNYNDLTTWFKEGNTFDGTDPRTPLATYIRSDEELAREKFDKMTDEQRRKLRVERTESQWRKALSKEFMNRVEDADLLIVGNVAPDRLPQVQTWAKEQLGVLRKNFRPGEGPLWKGRLAVFVLKDRFSYDEFNLAINSREAPKELTGHSVVTTADEDAYVCLLDVGDEISTSSPGLRANLIDHLTGAFVRRGGGNVPEWLIRGAGLVYALQQSPGNAFIKNLPGDAVNIAASVPRPEDVFADGTFSPGVIGPIGMTLVEFLMTNGGAPKFSQFVGALRQGQSVADAARAVYGTDLPSLAENYLSSLKRKR